MAKNDLPAIHPGKFLSESLQEMGISQAEFARAIGVSPMRVSHVLQATRCKSRESFKQEALGSWRKYKETGLHLTGEEVDQWLAKWGAAQENELNFSVLEQVPN